MSTIVPKVKVGLDNIGLQKIKERKDLKKEANTEIISSLFGAVREKRGWIHALISGRKVVDLRWCSVSLVAIVEDIPTLVAVVENFFSSFVEN